MKKKNNEDTNVPLCFGDTIPSTTNIMKKNTIARIYKPVPINIENSI